MTTGIDYTQTPTYTTNPSKTGVECWHYGQYVDSEVPIVGVVHNPNVAYLGEESQNGIDLDFLEHTRTCRRKYHDDCYGDGETSILIGSWKRTFQKGDDGKRHLVYVPDKSGEYSAHINGIYTLVHWSRHTERHALCSPCFAGCGDADTAGIFLCFVLPPEIMHEIKDSAVVEEVVVSMCPACGGANEPMGGLGTLLHYRCRDCGMSYSRSKP